MAKGKVCDECFGDGIRNVPITGGWAEIECEGCDGTGWIGGVNITARKKDQPMPAEYTESTRRG